jgi:hypothetical protein
MTEATYQKYIRSVIEKIDVERSTEEIRRVMANEAENISRTIEQISECINENLDWREHVKKSPYIALGTAAGIGYLTSKFIPTADSPGKRNTAAIPDNVRDSRNSLLAGSIKAVLLGVATKAAVRWITKATSTSEARDSGKNRTGS